MIERLGDASPTIAETAWVHASATVIGDVHLGEHASVWPGAVLRGDFAPIRIGQKTSIQDGTVIHAAGAGTFVGSQCVIGHQAFIEEAVVEDACLVGVGARVLNGARIGAGSVVAAGAVVVASLQVPPASRVQGVPGRVVGWAGRTRDQ